MKLNEFYSGSADEELLKSLSQENKIIDEEELNKAMNKAGLVQKEVQVRGKNGQTFTRKQWVKASEDVSQPNQNNKDSKKEDTKSTESKNFSPHQVGANNVSAYVNRKKYGDKNWFDNIGAVLAGKEKEFESNTGKKEAIRACKEAIRSHKRGIKDSNYRDSSYTKEHSQKLVDAETKLLSILENTPVKGEQPNKDNNTTDSKDSKQSFELPKDKSGLAKLLESGTSRDDIMSAAKAAGVAWKHSDHPGINWMRASMAITGTTTRGEKSTSKKSKKKIEIKTTNFGGKYEPYSWMTTEENDKLSKIPKYLDKPVDEWGDYSITQGNYHENFSSISELKSALKHRGLPESLANFNTNKFKSEDGYIQNDYRNAGVFAYPQINPEWDKAYDEASKASRSRKNK